MLRDGRATACARWPIRRGPSSPTTRRRRRAAPSRRRSRAAGRCSSRSRRSSRRPAYGPPRRAASGIDPNRLALLLAVLGRRAGVGLADARRLRQSRRRPQRRRARPGPAARGRPRVVAPRPAGRRRHRRRSARSACSASCAPVGGLERRLREAARLGFGRAIVPAAGARRPRRADVAGPRDRRRRDAPRGARGRPRRPTLRRGARRPRRDARLTAGRGCAIGDGARRRDTVASHRDHVIRFIRVLGAALGGLIGLALAVDSATACSSDVPTRGCAPRRLGRRLARGRLRVLPYLTIVPAGWLLRQVQQLSTAEFVDGGRRAAPRPPDGPPARPAAVRTSPARSGVAAARRLARSSGLGHGRPDRRQARTT